MTDWVDRIIKGESVQVSSKLRRGEGRYFHWCPGCEGMHPMPDKGWTFDGNLDAPTFTPSFMQSGGRPEQCHYVLTAGVMNFQPDCHHGLKGQSVPLPDLPEQLRD